MSTQLLPDTATVVSGSLVLGGVPVTELAATFGTPLYVYDAATLRARAAAYSEPLSHGGGRAMFALKANGTPGVLRILRAAGLGADVASAGEIALALAAGFTGADLVVHGNAKGDDDLAAALDAGAALVVLDAPEEAAALGAMARARRVVQDVLVRVTPDIAVDTHHKIRTGHAGSAVFYYELVRRRYQGTEFHDQAIAKMKDLQQDLHESQDTGIAATTKCAEMRQRPFAKYQSVKSR